MSNIPKEPSSWPAEAEGDAISGSLRQQVSDARQRLSEHWEKLGSLGVSMTNPGEDETQA